MTIRVPLSVVLVALVSLMSAPSALGKLPPGSAFEACGESGCRTVAGEESIELQMKLIEPTMSHDGMAAPADPQSWVRVDLQLPQAANGGASSGLRSHERSFPVVYAPSVRLLGLPAKGGAYRWISIEARNLAAYAQLTEGLRAFPPVNLAELDAASVDRARPDEVSRSQASSGGDNTPPIWAILLAVGGSLALIVVVARVRQLQDSSAGGEPA